MSNLKYTLRQFKNSKSEHNNEYYAQADHDETIDLEALSKHMSNHNTPFSQGTITGVLKDMVSCVRELLLDSKKVKLDDLAIFSLGLKGSFAETEEDFSASENIKGAHVNALGTGEFGYKQLQIDTTFKRV